MRAKHALQCIKDNIEGFNYGTMELWAFLKVLECTFRLSNEGAHLLSGQYIVLDLFFIVTEVNLDGIFI